MVEKTPEKQNYKHIVRIVNTDLDGSKPIYHALTKIKGVGNMFANAICVYTGVEKGKRTGALSPDDIQKLEGFIKNPLKFGAPEWMINRRKDPETGENIHLASSDLRFYIDNDLKTMKRIKSYKGVRHMTGLPVRGQKTKSNFRRNKGKSVGVQKKKGRK